LPVRLLGRRDDVPDLLAAADLVVSTSITEGQPVALQEAMLAGCAILATDVGGTGETVRDGAMLVQPVAGDLAGGIVQLMADPEKLAELRRRAANRAAQLPTSQDLAAQLRRAYAGPRPISSAMPRA
ncbi:MAG: glycosyltransferase, partial [Bifidobacteriaceae bacterium]|jgi:glycosyltransferase involved in cell wall biosynthesis|nr:glycosyltransferase [Bifidobacteriaceae bacterium]